MSPTLVIRSGRKRKASKLEERLAAAIQLAKLPDPVREFPFEPGRRWRFDFCWPEASLALEVEGGIFAQGRHARGAGIRENVEKYNHALILGWRVLRVTDQHIRNGTAIHWIELALHPRTRRTTLFERTV